MNLALTTLQLLWMKRNKVLWIKESFRIMNSQRSGLERNDLWKMVKQWTWEKLLNKKKELKIV